MEVWLSGINLHGELRLMYAITRGRDGKLGDEELFA